MEGTFTELICAMKINTSPGGINTVTLIGRGRPEREHWNSTASKYMKIFILQGKFIAQGNRSICSSTGRPMKMRDVRHSASI